MQTILLKSFEFFRLHILAGRIPRGPGWPAQEREIEVTYRAGVGPADDPQTKLGFVGVELNPGQRQNMRLAFEKRPQGIISGRHAT